jgi:rare lipoprotein A (peptidoglycan hydrolase)
VAVVALAAGVMVLAPLALLHSGAAPAAATGTVADGGRTASAPAASSLGDVVPLARDVRALPTTHAQAVRHAQAVHHARMVHAAEVRHAAAVQLAEQLRAHSLAVRAALLRHAAAVRQAEARHRAALARAAHRRAALAHSTVGVATWYAWHPGQCASPFLPHGTLVTVTDLATHKTIQCLVTDTEAHNPGRVVDLSQYCFEELAALSQGVIEVRISW